MDELKKQTDTKATIIIDMGTWKMEMADCTIFSNSQNDGELVALFQDKVDPSKKIQITLHKVTTPDPVPEQTPAA